MAPPAWPARLFGALGEHNLNVIAVAQGSSEANISLVLDAGDADNAVRYIHAAFGLACSPSVTHDPHAACSLIIFGAGRVGRALVRQLVEAAELHRQRDGLDRPGRRLVRPRWRARRRRRPGAGSVARGQPMKEGRRSPGRDPAGLPPGRPARRSSTWRAPMAA